MTCEKSCGAVVFTRINGEIKYVLVKSLAGIYGFPKGHMEENETEWETAAREIFEEVGLKPNFVDGFKTCDEYKLPHKNGVIKRITYFLAEYKDQKINVQKSELQNAHLMSYDEAMNVFQYESSRRILKEANDFLNNY